MKSIAFIDFDGTLLRNDSFPLFLIYNKGILLFLFSALLFVPQIIIAQLLNTDKGKIKEKWLRFHFKGLEEEKLKIIGDEFAKYIISSGKLRTGLLTEIKRLKTTGTECIIVSASPDLWIGPISISLDLDYICTELEFSDGRFSGRFKTPNCKGIEKKTRILKKFDLANYSHIISYGNSSDDLEMMSLANEQYWIR